MTEPGPATGRETERSHAMGIARGAGVIAGITIVARVLGLVRTLAFSQTVGASCLGTAYVTANQVPNIVYELVLGGALGSAMVPVLARSAERAGTDPAERAHVSQIVSALTTWALVLLLPLTAAVLAAATPIASLLNPANPAADCSRADLVATTAGMLRVFAPQILLFGLGVLLFGVLQAYRRFAAYALGPLVSSLVLIVSYCAFALFGNGESLSRLPASAQLILSGGATLGVAAMFLMGLVPTLRLHLRLRPAFRYPPGVARRAAGLVTVGLIEVVMQQVSGIVTITLANGRGDTGALVTFNYASQVFNTLNAVLALSVVVSAFPVLSAREGSVFDRACARSTWAVVLAAFLGVALTAAVAIPAAHVLASQPRQVPQLILGFVLYAPALLGTAVIANLTRALMVIGRLKIACTAFAGAWLLSALAQVVLAELVPAPLVVGALALGITVGMTGAAVPLVIMTRRIRGPAAVAGIGRAVLVGLVAAIAAGAGGVGVSLALSTSHKLMDGADGALAAACAIVVFGAAALRLDDGDLRRVLKRVTVAARLRVPESGVLAGVVRGYYMLAGGRTTRQVPRMNIRFHQHSGRADPAIRAGTTLTSFERQGALAIGTVAGGVGGYAVFASSNQAGTVMLLLMATVFLLIGLEGTSLRPGRSGHGVVTTDAGLEAVTRSGPVEDSTESQEDRMMAALGDDR